MEQMSALHPTPNEDGAAPNPGRRWCCCCPTGYGGAAPLRLNMVLPSYRLKVVLPPPGALG